MLCSSGSSALFASTAPHTHIPEIPYLPVHSPASSHAFRKPILSPCEVHHVMVAGACVSVYVCVGLYLIFGAHFPPFSFVLFLFPLRSRGRPGPRLFGDTTSLPCMHGAQLRGCLQCGRLLVGGSGGARAVGQGRKPCHTPGWAGQEGHKGHMGPGFTCLWTPSPDPASQGPGLGEQTLRRGSRRLWDWRLEVPSRCL